MYLRYFQCQQKKKKNPVTSEEYTKILSQPFYATDFLEKLKTVRSAQEIVYVKDL